MKGNNKGFSLVELLIVIGILAIIGSGAFMSFNVIHNANVNNSAGTINSTLAAIRMNNMSKVQTQYLQIYRVGGDYYYRIDDKAKIDFNYRLRKLGTSSTNISYITTNSTRISDNHGISISFNRSGECKLYNSDGSLNSADLNGITFYNSTRNKSIRILPAIGKHYLD